jgi:hypothetical protein
MRLPAGFDVTPRICACRNPDRLRSKPAAGDDPIGKTGKRG